MAMSKQTDFLKLGQYVAGDKLSYLGGFNTNMKLIDNFAKDTTTSLSTNAGGLEQASNQINAINDDIGIIQTDITGLKASTANLNSGLNNITASVRDLQNDRDTLEQEVNSLKSEDASLDNRITALENVEPSVSTPIYCKSFGEHAGGVATTTIYFPNIGIDDTNINKFKMIYTIFATYRRIINGDHNDILINTPIATGSYILSDKQPHRILDDTTTLALPASYMGIPEYEQDIYTLNITKDIAIGGYDTSHHSVVVQGNAQIFFTGLLYGPDKLTPSFGGISSNPWTPKFQFHLELARSI